MQQFVWNLTSDEEPDENEEDKEETTDTSTKKGSHEKTDDDTKCDKKIDVAALERGDDAEANAILAKLERKKQRRITKLKERLMAPKLKLNFREFLHVSEFGVHARLCDYKNNKIMQSKIFTSTTGQQSFAI